MTSAASHTPAYGAVDLSTCEREPIHVPGAVQPHGVLIALDDDLHVAMVSANCAPMLGTDTAAALGGPLRRLVGVEAADAIALRIAEWAPAEPLILWLPIELGGLLAGQAVDVTLHRSGERVVVELETWSTPRSTLLSYQSARAAMARLTAHTSLLAMTGQLAREVRELTRFDRVMVYRFDRQWNGEVIAEERRDDLNPFLGLHYPASDIPAQARRLYTVNWTRLIADVDYAPVHLEPMLDPDTGAPLDLTHATLRSVSPIHLEYLANMGVSASMSVSLIVDGELWGLVACHHYSGPHRPSQDARSAAEFLGQVASQAIADLERADAQAEALDAQAALARVTARITADPRSPLVALVEDPDLLGLVSAHGAAVHRDGRLLTRGPVPDPATLHRIAGVLLAPRWGEPAASDHLAGLAPDLAGVSAVAAGALGIGTGPESWLLLVRAELEQVVDWGGDPHNKALYAGEAGRARISPRVSFDRWREVIRGYAEPWTDWQLGAVRDLRTMMNAVLLQRSREQVQVAESLQRMVLADATPQRPGLTLAVRYLSASTFQLGGDWFDAFELRDARVAVVVGDVAGHGFTSVAAMTEARAALRAHLFAGHSPARALALLDQQMVQLMPDQVATAVVAVVDPAARTVELATAGHPPPLLLAADGTTEVDLPSRPLLGLGEPEGTCTTLTLDPGDTLVLYTDGLVERRDESLADSLARLRTRAERPDAAGGDVDLDAWIDRLVGWADGSGDDDTTVVAVRFD